jgi:hypothetical protein
MGRASARTGHGPRATSTEVLLRLLFCNARQRSCDICYILELTSGVSRHLLLSHDTRCIAAFSLAKWGLSLMFGFCN